jgi:hypothetical protein
MHIHPLSVAPLYLVSTLGPGSIFLAYVSITLLNSPNFVKGGCKFG